MQSLNSIEKNTPYKIIQITGPKFESQLLRHGLYIGADVVLIKKGFPFGDPLLFQVGNSRIALTKTESKLVKVQKNEGSRS